MLTINEVKKHSHAVGDKCFILHSPVALRSLRGFPDAHSPIARGEIVHATSFCDEHGKYRDTVYIQEKDAWWPVEVFELAEQGE